MLRLLRKAGGYCRRPLLREYLERAHVEIAVVKVTLEFRHLAREKSTILTDAVTTHR